MEPFSGDASRVLALLVLELDLQLAAKFLARARHEMLEAALEDVLPLEAYVNGLVFGPSPKSFQFSFEKRVFIIERQEVRRCC